MPTTPETPPQAGGRDDGALLERTACGLYVIPDGTPRGWAGFSWQQEVADMPGDQEEFDALALIAKSLMEQIGEMRTGGFVAPRDVAFAALHPGLIDRVPHPGLNFADPSVPQHLVDSDRSGSWWTVCGILEDTWEPLSQQVLAEGPLVAYYRAWTRANVQYGQRMLLAGVHYGRVPAIECFNYADPWARDGAAMQAKAREWCE